MEQGCEVNDKHEFILCSTQVWKVRENPAMGLPTQTASSLEFSSQVHSPHRGMVLTRLSDMRQTHTGRRQLLFDEGRTINH